jgi:hypothetical protein
VSRVSEVPVFARRDATIEAALYNLWRRARRYLSLPLRIEIPGSHNNAVLVLEQQEWVCVDEGNNDLPLLAWVDFQDQGRDALHLPVECSLNYYHYAASRLRKPALETMQAELTRRLKEIR